LAVFKVACGITINGSILQPAHGSTTQSGWAAAFSGGFGYAYNS
jgi:hypothetical protein